MNQMIDLSEALMITGGSKELFRQLMEVFIETSPVQMDRIKKAWKSENLKELSEAAHDVKSSASSIAAHNLYNSALKLEQSAKNILDLPTFSPMIKEVEEMISYTIQFYKTLREIHED